MHLKTDFEGHPIAFDLTGGEKGDAPHFPILLGLGPDVDPRAAMGDKGYDSKATVRQQEDGVRCPSFHIVQPQNQSRPSFPKRSTKVAPASNRQSENSNASSASHYGARRQN
ncbi:transposase [Serratia nematodiphila]